MLTRTTSITCPRPDRETPPPPPRTNTAKSAERRAQSAAPWRRTSTALGTSQVTISWETTWETGAWREDGSEEAVAAGKGKAKPGDGGKEDDDDGHSELRARATALDGTYRIRYYGDAKAFKGQITAFEGTSGTFTIA